VARQAFFNNDPKADKIKGIQSDIKTVQDIMMENIGIGPSPPCAPQTTSSKTHTGPAYSCFLRECAAEG
jgi:hypothetical protein